MAGIAQVFLTHNELEEMLVAFDLVKLKTPSAVTPKMTSGFDKLELALAPVACDTASGCKITDRSTTGHVHDWKCAPGCPRGFRNGVVPPVGAPT